MRTVLVAAFAALLMCSVRCETDEPEKKPVQISDVSFKEGKLWLEFDNSGETDVLLLNKFEPEFGVVTINALTEKNETIKLPPPPRKKDWIAAPEDRLRLRAKSRLTRAITVDLKPGRYTVSVAYEVKKDSYFMDAWFLKKGDTRENESKKVMSDFFFGTITSKDFEIVIPGDAKSSEKPEK